MFEDGPPDLWRALASPWRRRLLDELRSGPRTTGQLAAAFPELSRYAVMQHIEVLAAVGVVLAHKRGRERFNHLNPVPLRDWYERWVRPTADADAAGLLALRRVVEQSGESTMETATEQIHTVRIACELRFASAPAKVFDALTNRIREWFPHSYGGDRVRAVVDEPRVGGQHFEGWGGGAGDLYGHVTVYDPPHRYATRGRVMPGTILDAEYEITADAGGSVLRMSKVAVGPMTDEEAASISTYGDISRFADALRAVVEAD